MSTTIIERLYAAGAALADQIRLIGGADPDNNIQPFKVDADGNLRTTAIINAEVNSSLKLGTLIQVPNDNTVYNPPTGKLWVLRAIHARLYGEDTVSQAISPRGGYVTIVSDWNNTSPPANSIWYFPFFGSLDVVFPSDEFVIPERTGAGAQGLLVTYAADSTSTASAAIDISSNPGYNVWVTFKEIDA